MRKRQRKKNAVDVMYKLRVKFIDETGFTVGQTEKLISELHNKLEDYLSRYDFVTE